MLELNFFNLLPNFLIEELLNFILGLQLFNFILITVTFLLIISYLPRNIESLIFLHRLGFGYFIFSFILNTIETLSRINEDNNRIHNFIFYIQSDSTIFHFFLFFIFLILIIFFYGTIDRFLIQNGDELEFPLLIIFISGSALILFYVHTLIEFLLALETLSLASYICVGYERQNRHSTYASVQYFILSSIPSGFLILGVSILYSKLGVLNFEDLDLNLANNNISKGIYYFNLSINEINACFHFKNKEDFSFLNSLIEEDSLPFLEYFSFNQNILELLNVSSSTRSFIILIGILCILFNFLFKLTAAPFHF